VFIDWIKSFDKTLDMPDNWAIRLSVGNVDAFVLLKPAAKGVALTYFVATGFNPWATSPNSKECRRYDAYYMGRTYGSFYCFFFLQRVKTRCYNIVRADGSLN
jgi:hypothetical protein